MDLLKLTIIIAAFALGSCNNPSSETPSNQQNTNTSQASDSTPFLKDVDAKEAGNLLKEQGLVVLDVRTPAEFAAGHIDGAINIDFNGSGFKDELAKLDKDKTYLMHCRSGGRSSAAKPAFTELGFKSIYHLDGGIMAWEEAGLPTAK